MRGAWPAASSASTTCEPMNPDPPVTNTRAIPATLCADDENRQGGRCPPMQLDGDLVHDAADASDFLTARARRLARLPLRPERSPAERAEAEAVQAEADVVRDAFLRRHVRALYADLTAEGTKGLRADDLVYAAAERVPGLT